MNYQRKSLMITSVGITLLWLFFTLNPLRSLYLPNSLSVAHAQSANESSHVVYLPAIQNKQSNQAPQTTREWLDYLNYYRSQANLPPVSENPSWSMGGYKHSIYIVKNDAMSHDEDESNPYFTVEGREAARSGNLTASSDWQASDSYAIDSWMQAPFHALGVLDPALGKVGFGSYREKDDGALQMGATLDVLRGLGPVPSEVSFPVMWPADGKTTPLVKFWGEYPDPLSSCPGYRSPSGLPIILQIGPGNLIPQVGQHLVQQDGQGVEHCVFDETTYSNPNSSAQSLGRAILSARDAIVIIPRQPLSPGSTYKVSITVSGNAYSWTFTVSH